MNKTIKDLNAKLGKVQGDASEIETQLQTAWNEVLKDVKVISDAVTAVESSSEYGWDKYGEIVSWVHFDLAPFKECREYFETFMREYHSVSVDWDNDALSYSQGPGIVINEDGDVYDQDGDKFFIKKADYRNDDGDLDEAKRNELIEAYMEKNGYFPGVFSADRHGNIFHVKTNK